MHQQTQVAVPGNPQKLVPAFVVLLALASASNGWAWEKFPTSLIQKCTGPVRTVEAKIKVDRVGNVPGIPDNPPCGQPAEEQFFVTFKQDDSGNQTFGLEYVPPERKAHCKDLLLTIPENATICEIRYYRSNSEGRNYREQTGLRNTNRHREHEFAKKGPTMTKVRDNKRVIKVEYKNWRRSYDRYFGVQIDYQMPTPR